VSGAVRNDLDIAEQITEIGRKEAERATRKGPERVIKSVLIGSAFVINPSEKKFSKEPQRERIAELLTVASNKLYEAIQRDLVFPIPLRRVASITEEYHRYSLLAALPPLWPISVAG
jgi:hypothetical protein